MTEQEKRDKAQQEQQERHAEAAKLLRRGLYAMVKREEKKAGGK